MALRLGLGLIIGRDVSRTLVPSTSMSTSTLPTSTITRTHLLFNNDQQTGTLHLRIQSKMGRSPMRKISPVESTMSLRPLRFKKISEDTWQSGSFGLQFTEVHLIRV